MSKIKVMTVFGTRPEAIKMAPLIKELEKNQADFESTVVVTAQHREMLDQVLETFAIKPDFDLNIMKANQSLSDITSVILLALEDIIKEVKPDIILVHGDTTTTFAAGLAAFYQKVKIGHVEAGLRTGDIMSPYPEEANRRLIDVLSDLYFAPTTGSRDNLLAENVASEKVIVTGNTVIDALQYTIKQDYKNAEFELNDPDHRLVLLTMHRRENQGQPMIDVFKTVKKLVEEDEGIEVVYPVHLSPVVQELAKDYLGGHSRIHLISPLDVLDFHNMMNQSYLIMTDSGGVQEEAPSLGKPVLVLRDNTERPEGVEAGTLKLVGTNPDAVYDATKALLNDEGLYEQMAKADNPYGDGQASRRILASVKNYFENK
ncbi:UDP-N-acetylglucosamine 2-epimerase (non-hydrolyzing) [Vagococcus coleopterorum]|uniref:UDP-N-acetylglucosamine 2-epimerase (non-hydrolyzing) n=1 Tax=Vagococcus coleopterorum TaxID=2714946 RepID=A0A6G8AL38_9ENTE|nr:UDP-N-acetylglucosamine 2-epimerase (non-hydrolyzing) [Vagococcus coleopterorum]QIL45643.1 UDP-N-acetylglucosamine 2-epimerase (non-hydrolyzing) [Vagococcus coleopterorum]